MLLEFSSWSEDFLLRRLSRHRIHVGCKEQIIHYNLTTNICTSHTYIYIYIQIGYKSYSIWRDEWRRDQGKWWHGHGKTWDQEDLLFLCSRVNFLVHWAIIVENTWDTYLNILCNTSGFFVSTNATPRVCSIQEKSNWLQQHTLDIPKSTYERIPLITGGSKRPLVCSRGMLEFS